MANDILSDGTINWLGGMDTSRDPSDISDVQYSKGCNVIIPSSLGGIRARFGLHCAHLKFEDRKTKDIYRHGNVQGEGSFSVNGRTYLIVVVDGYVLKFKQIASNSFYVTIVNINGQNSKSRTNAWVTTIPNGCIVNNGFDLPIYVTENKARRTNPNKDEIGIGQMGVFLQHRLFIVDQSGKRILASDFNNPIKFTREDTNIFGFMCPDADELITAIGKQKSIIGTVEGGNLIWSSNKDIYSTDVRGSRTDWANLGSKVGKTTETVPGISAASPNSFESFNSNIYFRTKKYGLCDLRQSEFQFTQADSMISQSIEASYYFDNDTDWMLDKCYSRSCNKRMLTTVGPERNENGYIFWNGILSFHPAASYTNQGNIPRRFESIFTGVRPWCLTSVTQLNSRDRLYIHSYDNDKVNRLYLMNEDSDYDIDKDGNLVEIEGYIETKAYTHQNPLLLKNSIKRFYRLGLLQRTTSISVLCRPQSNGEWSMMYENSHLVGRNKIENGLFNPINHKPQTRPFVNMSSEKFSDCYSGAKFISIQYRIEFKGPLLLDSIIITAKIDGYDTTTSEVETQKSTLVYSYRPDYGYNINPSL